MQGLLARARNSCARTGFQRDADARPCAGWSSSVRLTTLDTHGPPALLERDSPLTPPAAPPRAFLRALAAAAGLLALGTPGGICRRNRRRANFDSRPQRAGKHHRRRARARCAARAARPSSARSRSTSAPARCAPSAASTASSPAPSNDAPRHDRARLRARQRRSAFGLDSDDLDGLRLTDHGSVAGVEHLAWEQRYRGIPVADAGLRGRRHRQRSALERHGPAGRRPGRAVDRARARRRRTPTRRHARAAATRARTSAGRAPRRAEPSRRRASATAAARR